MTVPKNVIDSKDSVVTAIYNLLVLLVIFQAKFSWIPSSVKAVLLFQFQSEQCTEKVAYVVVRRTLFGMEQGCDISDCAQ